MKDVERLGTCSRSRETKKNELNAKCDPSLSRKEYYWQNWGYFNLLKLRLAVLYQR